MNHRKNAKKVKKIFPRSQYASVRRGDIYYADLSNATVGSEQGGTRPVLIIQNNKGNMHSPTVIAAAITSHNKRGLPTHIELKDDSYGLSKNSTIMLEQIRTIDKTRLKEKIGQLDKEMMDKVDKAIFISFGIDTDTHSQSALEADAENAKPKEKSVKIGRRIGMRKHKGYNRID
jgi:mRNA interferase MazF